MTDTKTIRIVADHREERSGVVSALARDPEIQLEVRALEAGDYLIAEDCVIERKGSNGMDFTASIMDRRLFQQVDKIKELGLKAVFLIEGDVYQANPNLHENALIGALSYLPAIEGIPIVPVAHQRMTPMMIKTMARHMQHGLGYIPGLRPATPKSLPDRQRWLLNGLPGLGETRVEALLNQFGSPMGVLSASVSELCQTPGIGKKTAETIRLVLDSPG